MTNKKIQNKKKKKDIKLGKYIWIFGVVVLFIPLIIILLVNLEVFGKLPETHVLEDPPSAVASIVYSDDGETIGKYFNENRSPVYYDDLSPSLINALVATEDTRYYKHAGIDFWRSFTIIFHTLAGNKQGASTISQQLAKNLFPRARMNNPVKLVIRKLQEWVIATRLERLYTKEEIITMYLNTVEFGSPSIVGIQSASRTFFDKSPQDLNIEESAVLVGMLKAPGTYHPVRHPKKSEIRRNVVMDQMRKYGYLSREAYDSLKEKPMVVQYKLEGHNKGTAMYFREYLRMYLQKWADEKGYDIYSDGLKIYTSIDSKMQQYAEEVVYDHMKYMQKLFYQQFKNTKPWSETPQIIDLTIKRSERYRVLKELNASEEEIDKSFNTARNMQVFSYRGAIDTIMSPLDSIKYYKYFLQPGFMAMQPDNGYVKVWVGGVDFRFFKYDHVNPKAKRQVGSTFKPFVYAAAINNGFSPCQKISNTPVVFENNDNWSPKNDDGKYGGELSLRMALAQSVNVITARIMKEVGVDPVVKLAHRMGITSYLDPVPSLCLGVADISVYEMASAYNTINNFGEYVEPLLITRIEDKNGNIIQNFIPKTVEAMDKKKAYIMIDMLKSVADCHLSGTACRLRYKYNIRGPAGGKTGTTQNHSDGWFVGIIPQLTGAVWVGAEDRAVHFNNMNYGQGASLALPIWGMFLQKVYADKSLNFDPNKDWQRPSEDLGVEIDCKVYEEEKQTPEKVIF